MLETRYTGVSSAISLASSASAPSLFTGPAPPLTPSAAYGDIFLEHVTEKRQLGQLVRSDAESPEWGVPIFNQPRSRAGPVPSRSILDFGKEETKHKKLRDSKHHVMSPPGASRAQSGAPSSDRAYEEKTWTVEPALQGNGGLTNAMRSAAAASSGFNIAWIGTLGFPTDALPQTVRDHVNDLMLNEHNSEVVYVQDKDLSGHYTHFCKTVLWPIFHYQMPDHMKSKAYCDHSWEYYKNVNQAFANKVIASYRRKEVVWINDYHLLLVPAMVREKLPDARIGFFLHSAFPSSEIFRCLAKRKDLLEGMLGANLIAFQTDEYAHHFLQTCSRLLTVETTAEGVQLEDHFVNVTSQPIGINPPAIQEARESKEVQDWVRDIQKKYEGKMLIVARDKLDNVHGVRQNLLAFERFLKEHPEWVGKVVLIQVATSTAEQTDLLSNVSDICNRIDSLHSSLVSQSLVFLKQDIDFPQYLALLTVADAFMISALRDGMNLQAHEFIFCQDGQGSSKKHGPLILSEFTGSAAVFHDHIAINPWYSKGQADAINKALKMSTAEKERRWTNMHAIVMSQTGGRWAQELEVSLSKVHKEHRQQESTSVPRLSVAQISQRYKNARKRVIFLDYEGTLAPHKTRKGIPLTSPNRVIDTLNDLMTDPKNIVYIMSGRRVRELDSVFRTATGVGMIAENGCFIREYEAGADDWKSPVDAEEVKQWKKDTKAILDYFNIRMEGSRIDESLCSVLLRYDKVKDQEAATRQAGECADQINAACESYRIQAVPVHKAVLVQMKDYSKGTAATDIYKRLLATTAASGTEAPDFMMVVGDDREDEVVYRWANGLADEGTLSNVFTVSVGKRNTEARAALTQGSSGLLAVLQKLAKISLEMPVDDDFKTPRVRANMDGDIEAETA